MTEVISSALNFMRLPFHQAMTEFFEMVADRAIVDVVARLDDHASDQGRVDLDGQHRGPAEESCQPVAERVLLPFVERDGRADRDRPAVLAAVPYLPADACDRGDEVQAAMPVEDAEEAEDRRPGSPFERLGEDAVLLRRGDEWRGQQGGELR